MDKQGMIERMTLINQIAEMISRERSLMVMFEEYDKGYDRLLTYFRRLIGNGIIEISPETSKLMEQMEQRTKLMFNGDVQKTFEDRIEALRTASRSLEQDAA
jgi:hypothetical protein